MSGSSDNPNKNNNFSPNKLSENEIKSKGYLAPDLQKVEQPDRWAGCEHVPQIARDLADIGFKVLPIKTNGKRCLIKKWPSLASNDPTALEQLFAAYPDHGNVALATKGLLVLDPDAKFGRGGRNR